VVPIIRGGPATESWNIVRSCMSCNGSKSDQLPSEWCPTHEEAMEIEKRVAVVYPRMRNGMITGDHLPVYLRTRAICANFINDLVAEINGFPASNKKGLHPAWKSVERLKLNLDVIIQREGTISSPKEEFRHKMPDMVGRQINQPFPKKT